MSCVSVEMFEDGEKGRETEADYPQKSLDFGSWEWLEWAHI